MTREKTIAKLRELLAGQFSEEEFNRRLTDDGGSINLKGVIRLKKSNLCASADLKGANLRNADLEGLNLSWSSFEGADLEGANLQGADLGRALLFRVNLKHAKLGRALLDEAVLRGTDLSWADLEGANLRKADLEGANLNGAKLKEVKELVPGQLARVGVGLEFACDLPPGTFADAVAAGYKPAPIKFR